MAGYLLDLVAKLRNRIFVPHSLMKLHNLKLCRDLTGATTVVEIGTYKGVTAKRLSRLFNTVVTVEIDSALHAHAKERCRGRSNIEFLLGDGAKLLPQIAGRVRDAVLFLDGHFSGAETSQGDEPEPVLAELDHITPWLDHFSAIVVDDFRLFGIDKGWPKKSEVLAKLETIFPETQWQLSVHNDQFLVIRLPPAK
jgi:hypothetical protein